MFLQYLFPFLREIFQNPLRQFSNLMHYSETVKVAKTKCIIWTIFDIVNFKVILFTSNLCAQVLKYLMVFMHYQHTCQLSVQLVSAF